MFVHLRFVLLVGSLIVVSFGRADDQVCVPVANQWADCINLFPSCVDGCISAIDYAEDLVNNGANTRTCTNARSVACIPLTCCSFCATEASTFFDCLVEPLRDPSCNIQQCLSSTTSSRGLTGSGGSSGGTTNGFGYIRRNSIGIAIGIMVLSLWMTL